MNGIVVRENESIESAILRFGKICNSTLTELKDRRTYVKPSAVARKKKMDAIRKRQFKEKLASLGIAYKEKE